MNQKKTCLSIFSIIDVVSILAETTAPKRYRSDLKQKLQCCGNRTLKKLDD
jgi:hypothetical protein